MKFYTDLFSEITSPENLFSSWAVFKNGKRNKPDVMRFERNLEANIFELHRELRDKTYRHGSYESFYIHDPKQRNIHKAFVRDRILHHAIFAVLNPIFEETFIPTSFSCRVGYGTHRGIESLETMIRKVSRNGLRDCFVLKCDIRKFFDSVDHDILLAMLGERIRDERTMCLLRTIVESYSNSSLSLSLERERERVATRKGIPIGNLTSQLFANVYMNAFDQFMKHGLSVRYYSRYTDDFAIVSENKEYLENLLPKIENFLHAVLALQIHPKKIALIPFRHGVDFLGCVIFPKYRTMRTKTKRRMLKKLAMKIQEYELGKIDKSVVAQSVRSYLGVLSHVNAHGLSEELLNRFHFFLKPD